MPKIGDIVILGAGPQDGAVVNAYKASRFGSIPQLNAAPPAGAVDAGPITSGPAWGGTGAFQITVPTDEDYYCSATSGGTTAWQFYPAVENADLVQLAGAQTITGQKTFNAGVLLDKGSAFHNVKAYGAVGDGATNDTTSIQAAITAAAVTGGTVYFPAGTYLCGTITLQSKVHLKGAGYEATIIKLANTTNATLLLGANFATLTGGNTTGGISQWSISDLTLDGNKANNTLGFGIQVYAFGYSLHDLRVRNCPQDGIYTEWSSTAFGAPAGSDSMEASFVNVKAHDNGNNGITWMGPHDSVLTGVIVYGNAAKGFHCKTTVAALLITNSHSWNNTDVCWYLEGECALVNCVGEGTGGAASNPQVFVGSNDCQFIGGSYYASSTGKIGFTIGDGSHTNIQGIVMDTKILNCSTAAIYLNQDGGGNTFRAEVYNCATIIGGSTVRGSRYNMRAGANRGGSITTPAIPASTVAVVNTSGVDATVVVTGGTVSAIVVDGVTIGITAGSYRLPCGLYTSITYTVAPTWKWIGD